MARVALIKPFTGLNLGVAQLSAELQRAGHETLVVYFKDFVAVPVAAAAKYRAAPYPGLITLKRGTDWTFTGYKPVTEREYELLLLELDRFKPDLVGLSLISSAMDIAEDVTARIRRHLAVPVIWGGSGPTLERERTLKHADLLCTSEGEEVIVELAERLDSGTSLVGVPGTWARSGDSVVRNPDRPLLSLDSIAAPDFEPSRTIRIEDDRVESDVRPPVLFPYVIMAARGCPFSCSFCIESVYQDMFGKKGSLRRRSVDLVLAELVEAKRTLDIRSVQFFDDVFTTHRKWLAEFGPKYRARVDLPFWCYTYPTITRKDDIALLREAGCVSMSMGIQSGSERMLKERFHRPTPLRAVLDAAKTVTDAGIDLYVDLITRIDFETEDDLRANVELLMELPRGVRVCGFGHMVKFPNYGYSELVNRTPDLERPSDDVYAYYHRLYYVALSSMPYSTRRAVVSNPLYRRRPELLDALMADGGLTLLLVPTDRGPKSARVLVDTTTMQATVPDEFLGPPPTPDARKRLSILQ